MYSEHRPGMNITRDDNSDTLDVVQNTPALYIKCRQLQNDFIFSEFIASRGGHVSNEVVTEKTSLVIHMFETAAADILYRGLQFKAANRACR